jgi:hypothetical protein
MLQCSWTVCTPLIVFPRVKRNPAFEEGLPPETVAIYHPSGWMQTEIFAPTWINHFLQFTNPSKERPILLILDGHMTHVKKYFVARNCTTESCAYFSSTATYKTPPAAFRRLFYVSSEQLLRTRGEMLVKKEPTQGSDSPKCRFFIWAGFSKGCNCSKCHKWV